MTYAPSLNPRGAISTADLNYERERLRLFIHDAVLHSFMQQVQLCGLTRAELARRLGKKPEQITRWLGGPGNWTIDTMADLLFASGIDPTSIFRDRLSSEKDELPSSKAMPSAAHHREEITARAPDAPTRARVSQSSPHRCCSLIF